MSREVSNMDDLIDSRDVIARIEELRADKETSEADPDGNEARDWLEENGAELAALESLASEAEGHCADWIHGETLIRDSYFETYAQELADDIGATNHDLAWPHTCIDWERAARELQMDYTSVEFDGVAYWAR